MLTINDIINASFNKSNFGGYKTEDVDIFIDEVKESYELLIKKNIEQKEKNSLLVARPLKVANFRVKHFHHTLIISQNNAPTS